MSYDAKKKVTLGQAKALAQAAASGGGGGASPSAVAFAAADWTAGDPCTMTLTADRHGRGGGDFVYQAYSRLADGSYKSGTWDAAGVGARYLSSGAVELSAPQAFAGKIVFL